MRNSLAMATLVLELSEDDLSRLHALASVMGQSLEEYLIGLGLEAYYQHVPEGMLEAAKNMRAEQRQRLTDSLQIARMLRELRERGYE